MLGKPNSNCEVPLFPEVHLLMFELGVLKRISSPLKRSIPWAIGLIGEGMSFSFGGTMNQGPELAACRTVNLKPYLEGHAGLVSIG